MAAGVPVVASDLPGMATIVRETGCGVLCDPADPGSIAARIRSVLDGQRRKTAAAGPSGDRGGARDLQTGSSRPRILLDEYGRLTGRPVVSGGRRGRRRSMAVRRAAPSSSSGTGLAVSRGLRIARALAAEGFAVEIAAVSGEGLPDRERDGEIEIRRYRPSGWSATMAATYRDANATRRRRRRWSRSPRGRPANGRGAPSLDLLAAYGPRLVGDARARARDGRRVPRLRQPGDRPGPGCPAPRPDRRSRIDRRLRRGRQRLEGNSVLGMPGPVRAVHRARERRWARSADARTTVNEALADRLRDAWGVADPPLVLPNYPERIADPDAPAPDLVRARLGLPPTTRVVEFQGRLGPNLGLDEAAEAVLRVPTRSWP
jgi:glycosyltransferase involved in cell wall biosynthesis